MYLKKAKIDKSQKYVNDLQNNMFYCEYCGHTNYFMNKDEKKLCSHCGHYTRRQKRSVADINMIKLLKTKYRQFLERNEMK